ncbi:hypothetical protein FDP41_005790 [Naegleria fowleri]|uniref:CNH domain-containing protein n=1 Tax=Naegleria fowleri TaxID=5763 RepID=A0A6A5BD95_NAEFO|nr:uncharacterized protein FDP41_005790 [Naegleria fowleri]KAF0975037.1 hypothetical protein FDP41_005790 [Naegleria fowleri]CAG4716209.1 unnamed protein product [Naegleria fowleri]
MADSNSEHSLDSKKRKMNTNESIEEQTAESSQYEIVVLNLLDFHDKEEFISSSSSLHDLTEIFTIKMRSHPLVPFSLNFEATHTFGTTNSGRFMDYGDIKNMMMHACYAAISHKFNTLLVCDPQFIGRGRIQVFDLDTKKPIKSIYLIRPRSMCVEKHVHTINNNEYLIVSCQDGILKLDLTCLLLESSSPSQKKALIWKNDHYKHPIEISSMDILYARKYHPIDGDHWIFICKFKSTLESSGVDILSVSTGQCLSKITNFLFPPYGIATSNSERFVAVVETKGSSIKIFEQVPMKNKIQTITSNERNRQDGCILEWKCVIEVPFNDQFPNLFIQRLLVYDEVSKNLIMYDCCIHLIMIFNMNGGGTCGCGQYIKSHLVSPNQNVFHFSEIAMPHAICLNDHTGELIVWNQNMGCIQIYK